MKFQYIKDKVSAYFTKGNERSVAVKKNIAVSLVLKCISILVSLQVVPLTIGYVNPTKYGIWLTLSSIIAWLSYFDLGFAHGFRNRFAEAKAKGDMKLVGIAVCLVQQSDTGQEFRCLLTAGHT